MYRRRTRCAQQCRYGTDHQSHQATNRSGNQSAFDIRPVQLNRFALQALHDTHLSRMNA